MKFLSDFVQGCLDLIAPPMCCRCFCAIEERRSTAASLCENCIAELCPPVESICRRCAAPAATASIDESGCWRCRTTRFRFTETVGLGVYQNDLREAVLHAKHDSTGLLAASLCRMLAERVKERFDNKEHDFIVSVPMHILRRSFRRVNLPYTCGELLAEELAIAHQPMVACDRLIERQSSLAPSVRSRNVRGAYRLKRPHVVEGRSVLLVDDILTTGATCNVIARELKKAGASRVDVAVLARGIGWA